MLAATIGLRQDGVGRVHIPVITNPEVEFFLQGELIDMRPGEAWYLNFNLPHRVENRSSEARVHLVVDCIVNDWFLGFFTSSNSGQEICS